MLREQGYRTFDGVLRVLMAVAVGWHTTLRAFLYGKGVVVGDPVTPFADSGSIAGDWGNCNLRHISSVEKTFGVSRWRYRRTALHIAHCGPAKQMQTAITGRAMTKARAYITRVAIRGSMVDGSYRLFKWASVTACMLLMLALPSYGQILAPILAGATTSGGAITWNHIASGVSGCTPGCATFNVQVGDVIWITIRFALDATTPTCSDTASNTFASGRAVDSSGADYIYSCYSIVTNANSSDAVSVTYGGSAGFNAGFAEQYRPSSGTAVAEAHAGGFTASSTGTSSSFSTTNTYELVLSGCTANGAASWSAGALSSGPSFTLLNNHTSTDYASQALTSATVLTTNTATCVAPSASLVGVRVDTFKAN